MLVPREAGRIMGELASRSEGASASSEVYARLLWGVLVTHVVVVMGLRFQCLSVLVLNPSKY